MLVVLHAQIVMPHKLNAEEAIGCDCRVCSGPMERCYAVEDERSFHSQKWRSMIAHSDPWRVAIQSIVYNKPKTPEARNEASMKGQEIVQADENCFCHNHLHETS